MNYQINHKRWSFALRITLVCFLILTFIGFFYVNREDNNDKEYITYAAELRVLIEQFTRSANEAVVQAKPDAFKFLRYRTNEFSTILEILSRGKQDSSGRTLLPPSPLGIRDQELADLSRLWVDARKNAETILDNQGRFLNLHTGIVALESAIQTIRRGYLDLIDVLSKKSTIPGSEYAIITSQIVRIVEIGQEIREILDTEIDHDVADLEKQFATRVENFDKNLQIQKSKYSNEVIFATIMDIDKAFSVIKNRSPDVASAVQMMNEVNGALQAISSNLPNFLQATVALEKAYSNAPHNRWLNDKSILILSIITVLIGIALLLLVNMENRSLQSEIKKLVHELKDLGTGNLAVHATGGLGVTGSIAEAINYALNALRKLVQSINKTSEKVSHSALDVKQVAEALRKAIHNQTDEIIQVAETANTMSNSINKVAESARKSAKAAEDSVTIAHDGAVIVNDTIAGMERIREQIQKTEKRIKQLGESSQEIGEIVSLIGGISEQTNLLSLNASIQAAMAGDVGLGFAVVADEVQQLAVKSSLATKEVATLVKAIQTDTTRAIESMEEASLEAIEGAKLAHDAGKALEKIESVSKNLAELIDVMSVSAEEQVAVATKIAQMMGIIESIAEQTATGTETTSDSIGELAKLVQELRNSVSEFKLPEVRYGEF